MLLWVHVIVGAATTADSWGRIPYPSGSGDSTQHWHVNGGGGVAGRRLWRCQGAAVVARAAVRVLCHGLDVHGPLL